LSRRHRSDVRLLARKRVLDVHSQKGVTKAMDSLLFLSSLIAVAAVVIWATLNDGNSQDTEACVSVGKDNVGARGKSPRLGREIPQSRNGDFTRSPRRRFGRDTNPRDTNP
jgi:hypothetical protein